LSTCVGRVGGLEEGARGRSPRKKKIRADIFPSCQHISGTTYFRDHMILGGFSAHGFLPMVFLFLVKELGFWTNPGHWVRVLDSTSSYMYIVL
jgi:hypothetical protein